MNPTEFKSDTLTSALDFFGDSTNLAAIEQKPAKTRVELGKRSHTEVDPDSDDESIGTLSKNSEEVNVSDGEDVNEDVALKIFSNKKFVKEERGTIKKRKKRTKRETKELLRREEVC